MIDNTKKKGKNHNTGFIGVISGIIVIFLVLILFTQALSVEVQVNTENDEYPSFEANPTRAKKDKSDNKTHGSPPGKISMKDDRKREIPGNMSYQENGMAAGGIEFLGDNNTLAYYSFNNASGPGNDDSGNGLDLTISGAGQSGNSLYGRTLYFEGSNDYASIPDDNSMDIRGTMTIDLWVFWKGAGTSGSYDTLIAQSEHFWLYVRRTGDLANKICFSAGDPWESIVSNSELARNEWNHLSIVRTPSTDNNENVKMYINGVLDSENDIDESSPTGAEITYIGAWGGSTHNFRGFVDEVSISDTEREIGDTVGFWNFNENSGNRLRDRSPQKLMDGTISGATLTDGIYGKALDFDGSNDYVSIPSDDRLHLTGKTTIEAWVKYDGAGIGAGSVDTIVAQEGHFWIFTRRTGPSAGKIVFESGNTPWTPDVYSDTALSTGVWTHIAVVRTSNIHVKIYINGLLDGEGNTYAPDATSANTLYIGGYAGTFHNFNGTIDEVRISNFDATYGGTRDYGGDVLDLPFEGVNDASRLDDRSPLDNDMDDTYGSITYGSTSGKYGGCYIYDGTSDRLKMDSLVPSELNPPTITVEAWIYPTDLQLSCIIDNSYRASEQGKTKGGYVLRLRETGAIQFLVYDDGENSYSAQTISVVSENDWWHVAGVSDGNDVRVYINGVCEATATFADDIGYGSDMGLFVGSKYYGDGQYFEGRIDEVRISCYPRTFHGDTDGDGMSDMYELMRSNCSDQYNPVENNGRHALLVAPNPEDLAQEDAFWNDAKFMYDALKSYGYLDSDIHLLHSTGTDVKTGDYATPMGVTYTDGPATPAELQTECTNLSNVVLSDDFLLVSVIDHGSRNAGTNHSFIRMNDGEGGHTDLQDDAFAGNSYVGKITNYKYRTFFLQPAYAGGFINDLSSSKTVIATACKYNEASALSSGDGDEVEGENGEFDFYFMSAFAGHTPTNGVYISPDAAGSTNIDGMASVWEAYKWDESHENRFEHPQIDDDSNSMSQQDGDTDDGINLADKLYL